MGAYGNGGEGSWFGLVHDSRQRRCFGKSCKIAARSDSRAIDKRGWKAATDGEGLKLGGFPASSSWLIEFHCFSGCAGEQDGGDGDAIRKIRYSLATQLSLRNQERVASGKSFRYLTLSVSECLSELCFQHYFRLIGSNGCCQLERGFPYKPHSFM